MVVAPPFALADTVVVLVVVASFDPTAAGGTAEGSKLSFIGRTKREKFYKTGH